MSTILYYFTGTGNSLYIAKSIAEVIPNTQLIPIQTYHPIKKISAGIERVGIIYPTYFLDAPKNVMSFIKQLEIPKETYVFLYTNYGGTKGNALYNPYKLLSQKGHVVSATFGIALPDNSIVFPTDAKEIPKMLKKGKALILHHAETILNQERTDVPKLEKKNKLLSGMMKPYCHFYLGFDAIQIDDEACSHCGICQKVCSNQNIKNENKTFIAGKDCLMCFSCIHYCPKQAISFKRMKPKSVKYQYTHPEVTIKEMMASRL